MPTVAIIPIIPRTIVSGFPYPQTTLHFDRPISEYCLAVADLSHEEAWMVVGAEDLTERERDALTNASLFPIEGGGRGHHAITLDEAHRIVVAVRRQMELIWGARDRRAQEENRRFMARIGGDH